MFFKEQPKAGDFRIVKNGIEQFKLQEYRFTPGFEDVQYSWKFIDGIHYTLESAKLHMSELIRKREFKTLKNNWKPIEEK